MSGAASAIDTLSAEEVAQLNDMREDAPFDAPEAGAEAEAPEATELDLDADDGAEPVAPEKRKSATVPYDKFHAVNERRKAAEARAAEADKARAVSEGVVAERLRLLTEAAQAAMPKAPDAAEIEIPDITLDPTGHFKAVAEKQQRELAEVRAILSGFTEQQRMAQTVQELRSWGESQEAEFRAREPSYGDAMAFLMASRNGELEAIGTTDPIERRRIIGNDITQIAAKARQDGVNFGERLFNVALKRGFQKAAPKPAVPALDAEDAPQVDRVARIERGRDSATSIASVGATAPRPLTPDRIAAMTEGQFAQYLAKIEKNPTALRDLLGH